MTRIAVVGSINIDLTSYLNRWPGVGETVSATQTQITLGGKGANQAVAAARLGSHVTMIGAVGEDGFGADAVKELERAGVSLRLCRNAEHSSGMAFIDVGPDGGNIIRLAEGANGTLSAQDIASHAESIRQSNLLLLQNEVSVVTSVAAARIARRSGALIIMDPAPAPVPFWTEDILANFDIITPNAHETALILGTQPADLGDARQAAEHLSQKVARGAIVTMGRLGVAWFIDGVGGQRVAPNVPAIDTVAAGDCFNGGFAHGLAHGASVEEAIRAAVDAAAFATTQCGASVSAPSIDQLEKFRSELYLDVQWG